VKVRSLFPALILTLFASWAIAAPTSCPRHYLGGQAPDIANETYSQKNQEVCYSFYALIHSGVTRTPLTAAEHLTAAALQQCRPDRTDHFHPDPHIAKADRAELEDYENSGFDRGHMAAFADMPDEKSQRESFSLANMIPQDKNLNRNLWEGIEEATRALAITSGELYVITGPIYYGTPQKPLKERVAVPTYVFKAIYDPTRKQGAAYLTVNSPGGRYAVVPIAVVEQLTGITLFPSLSTEVKRKSMALPKPTPNTRIPVTEDQTLVPKTPAIP
jgi:endonuclease G, mitochondrial